MRFCSELYAKVNRKKLLFGLTIIYSVIFACVLYTYGWNFLPVFKVKHAPKDVLAQSPDVVLKFEYDDNNSSKVLVHRPLDIHLEDPQFGHIGSATHSHIDSEYGDKIVVAIGGGITSRKLEDVKPDNLRFKFQFFTVLLPSFCRTATFSGYHYNFYLAYDSNDAVFSQPNLLDAFQKTFDTVSLEVCSSISLALHFVECHHTGHPAWAQNDAMIEAYLDGSEYFYRVNDDSVMKTGGWTDVFIDTLAAYNPPNTGVVGPKHSGGNEIILTYDFVHRTHVDLFGYYYPRVFTDWYADDWITKVYLPNHSTKIKTILLEHTMKLGQRYTNNYSIYPKLEIQLKKDKKIVNRYVQYRRKTEQLQYDRTKVISMSLYGKNPRYTWGAIRNAQLLPVVFPGWTLRVYVPEGSEFDVPTRIIACLKRLGVQIVHVKTTDMGVIPPRWWRYLIVDDASVEYFLIRDADSRLSERDALAVNDWISSAYSVHCIRDLPTHASQVVVDGLWGGKPKEIRKLTEESAHSILSQYFAYSDSNKTLDSLKNNSNIMFVDKQIHVSFLNAVLWPRISSASVCHDSVSCKNWTRTLSFPSEEQPSDLDEYLGQEYNEFQVVSHRQSRSAVAECSGRGKLVFNGSDSAIEPRRTRSGNQSSDLLAEGSGKVKSESISNLVVITTKSAPNLLVPPGIQ